MNDNDIEGLSEVKVVPELILPKDEELFEEEDLLPEDEGLLSEEAMLRSADQLGIIESRAWCPGGSTSGGVCGPFNNSRRSTWMYSYRQNRSISSLPIGEAILPGTHNSAYDKEAPRTPSSEVCQDVSPYKQLMAGIRVLDLRVQFFSGNSGSGRFAIFHNTANGRNVETDILDALSNYRRDAGANHEIVILNFHQFKNFTETAHAELASLIKRKLGASIVPPTYREAAVCQLWALGTNTVISYNHGKRDKLFWEGVEQRWIGIDIVMKNTLKHFVQHVGDEPKTFGRLKSIQCAYYSLPFYVPKDISGEIMQWFEAGSRDSPIQKYYIINTDWSLRQRLIDNVIFANGFRAEIRGAHVNVSSPNSVGSIVPAASYGIFELYDGNWVPSISIGQNTEETTTIQVIKSEATFDCELKLPRSQVKIRRGDRLVLRVRKGAAPELIDHIVAK
ncbi:hypothetical protein D3C76_414220 [compost metagenome]